MSAAVRRYRRSSEVLFRCVGDEVLLALPDRDDFSALSATGAAVWQLIASPRASQDLVAELGRRFDAEPHRIAEDVDRLLATIGGMGLVEELESG